MRVMRPGKAVDVNDGVALRVYYEGMRGWLNTEQASWREHWAQLARFTLPRQQRFNWEDTDNGQRQDQSIVDNTATMAVQVLAAGLVSGVCSPTRTWFNLEVDDKKLNDRKEVKQYLEDCADILRASLLRSNFYQTMHGVFREEALFGTSAFQILEDDETDARCYPWPVGSYFIAGDETNRIDLFMRQYQMTVRQIVDKFGYSNVSSAVQSLYDSNAGGVKEQWFPIVNVIHPSKYFGEGYLHKGKPWVSIWYEMGPYGNSEQRNNRAKFGLLRFDGFMECPVVAPRWDVIGEDFYGISPGMNALGDTMGLQLLSMTTTKAIDKMVDPPMLASPHLANQKLSILPGDVTYADTREGNIGFKPVYEVRFDVDHASRREEEHRKRIGEAYFKNLFMMFSGSDRRDITAEEIRARQEEKMQVVGPVLMRTDAESLTPSVKRWLAILARKGKLPAPPEILRDKKIIPRFVSLLAQAQQMLQQANLDRFMATVGQQAALNRNVWATVNLDKGVRETAKNLSIKAEMLNTEEEAKAILAQMQKDQQQAQQADYAQKTAMAAKNLSQTDTSGQNGLTDLLHSTTGAGA